MSSKAKGYLLTFIRNLHKGFEYLAVGEHSVDWPLPDRPPEWDQRPLVDTSRNAQHGRIAAKLAERHRNSH